MAKTQQIGKYTLVTNDDGSYHTAWNLVLGNRIILHGVDSNRSMDEVKSKIEEWISRQGPTDEQLSADLAKEAEEQRQRKQQLILNYIRDINLKLWELLELPDRDGVIQLLSDVILENVYIFEDEHRKENDSDNG